MSGAINAKKEIEYEMELSRIQARLKVLTEAEAAVTAAHAACRGIDARVNEAEYVAKQEAYTKAVRYLEAVKTVL